jgi:hypothetical protein
MKPKMIYPLLSLLLLGAGCLTPARAQSAAREPGTYWVVETNQHDKSYSIVRFYDRRDQLLYEEKLWGLRLDVTRPRTHRLLNKTLREVTNKSLVAGQLKRSRPLLAAAGPK